MKGSFNAFSKVLDNELPRVYLEAGIQYPSGIRFDYLEKVAETPVLEVEAYLAEYDAQKAQKQ